MFTSPRLRIHTRILLICSITVGFNFTSLPAEIEISALFSDGMVLQRQKPIPVWGWANPGEKVTVSFRNQLIETNASTDGRWEALLSPEDAGGPDVLVIDGDNRIRITDVLVGEVWLCSGQSNMAWPVRNSLDAEREIQSANWPRIRLFTVERRVADKPERDISGEWLSVTPETVQDFSAVGYYFGRFLHTHLEIPVGLIHSSWGGTPIESWMKLETLTDNMDYSPIVQRFQTSIRDYPQKKAAYEELLGMFESGAELPQFHQDPGNQGVEEGWAKTDFDDSSWQTLELPDTWESANILEGDGAVWFRKEFEIPAGWSGKPLVLALGPIDDFDVTYFNGEEIGYTNEEMPNYRQYNRHYLVPEELVQSGRAVIAVRVFDHFGEGGFRGSAEQMQIWPEREEIRLSLSGEWKYRVEVELNPYAITGPGDGKPRAPMGPDHPHRPAGLYNAMIYPLAPYPIRGVIWYQGEANTSRAYQYRSLLADMISDWRVLWNREYFHFGIVQLANYGKRLQEPSESEWAELREAQALVTRQLPRTFLAVTIDIGEANDIHPRNKQDVGKRLARWPMKYIYGENVPASGPVFQSYQIWGKNMMALQFENVFGGFKSKNREPIKGFTVAGVDRVFYPAIAQVRNGRVVVWSERVRRPVAVRYGWANNPDCNLYNNHDLPAVPFRTDNWPGITINRR